ncbi:MAG: helicase, partial [Planctomycetes bacterium]|nr:helicase [Planctomycetota bacterium]
MNFEEARQAWLAWMRGALQGPRAGDDEELARSPLDCYCSGILTPAATDAPPRLTANADHHQEVPNVIGQAGESEPDEADSTELDGDTCTNVPPTASVGLSFLVTSDVHLDVLAEGAMYDYERAANNPDDDKIRPRWLRKSFSTAPGECEFRPPTQCGTETRRILGGRADVVVRWRNHSDNWLVTVALVNRVTTGGGARLPQELAKACFFQARLACVPLCGRILPYPRLEGLKLTEEEEELELQYRDKRVFAIGHGAAADWTVDGNGYVTELAVCFLPAVEVPLVTTQNLNLPDRSMDLAFLADCDKRSDEVIGQLDEFIDRYAAWVEAERENHRSNDSSADKVSSRITKRQRYAVERMRRGCQLLRTDDKARHAFSLAQDAMLQQMIHVRLVQGQMMDKRVFTWRPFQLAFLLLAIESVVNPESAERDVVDLLWFPTGGGKTEAYLALIAVLIVYRRLRWPGSGGGTAVVMRYTLRLLTAQQFQRATALICALELMRRRAPREELGNEPITGGLWVGAATTPNRNEDAVAILTELETGQRGSRGLFLDQCPWCGTRLLPSSDDCGNPGAFGIRREGNGIVFFCPKQECDFHDRLPFHVVDEHLYAHPPTLLLATLDKFARLTWEERTSVFFGSADNRPPEMIIQDELHLIAGPLGSFAGLYEAAISTVL